MKYQLLKTGKRSIIVSTTERKNTQTDRSALALLPPPRRRILSEPRGYRTSGGMPCHGSIINTCSTTHSCLLCRKYVTCLTIRPTSKYYISTQLSLLSSAALHFAHPQKNVHTWTQNLKENLCIVRLTVLYTLSREGGHDRVRTYS